MVFMDSICRIFPPKDDSKIPANELNKITGEAGMIHQNDWRLTNQINYLYGKKLKHIYYQTYKKAWNHDHCEFCNDIICNETKRYYCTLDQYHWICETCFTDFKDMFNWKTE